MNEQLPEDSAVTKKTPEAEDGGDAVAIPAQEPGCPAGEVAMVKRPLKFVSVAVSDCELPAPVPSKDKLWTDSLTGPAAGVGEGVLPPPQAETRDTRRGRARHVAAGLGIGPLSFSLLPEV